MAKLPTILTVAIGAILATSQMVLAETYAESVIKPAAD
ncbi:MAG: hypothetical protein JWM80_2162, partial [Cyanobacteria bacterium RYN_339]|nr:hypothetical protein [Cyanobacteria bacterium RYN_339]MDB5097741.1 hypothetical protein [Cyanobacteria bacterium RYN_339]